MEIEVGSSYVIIFDVAGKYLTFNCRIVSNEGDFITFIDKFGKILTYNKKNIVSVEEVGNE